MIRVAHPGQLAVAKLAPRVRPRSGPVTEPNCCTPIRPQTQPEFEPGSGARVLHPGQNPVWSLNPKVDSRLNSVAEHKLPCIRPGPHAKQI